MITMALVLAALAGGAFASGGYLVGARRGAQARAALLSDNAAKEEAIRAFDVERAMRVESRPDDLHAELRALAAAVSSQERSQESLKLEIHQHIASMTKMSPDPDALKKDIESLVKPLLRQRENETRKFGDMMREVLAPMLDRERLGRELLSVKVDGTLRELPRVLDAIAEKGGFSTVVLADDVGLPLAANTGARDVEALAGVSSMLLTLADRAEAQGEARPNAVLIHDAANQVTLHRMFQVGSSRFVLTALGRGLAVGPSALDAVLPKLERALTRPDLHA